MKAFAEFPQYRKYSNDRHWFRVESDERFTEVYRMGDRYFAREFVAKIYPDRLLIADLLAAHNGIAHSDEQEFTSKHRLIETGAM
jgi:hypothetical protein